MPASTKSLSSKVVTESENTIDVHIIQARDLCPRDKEFGFLGKKVTSDPYVLLCWEGEVKGRTKTISKNLSPRWNETLHIEVKKGRFKSKYSKFPPLELRLFDEDQGQSDDGMGIVEIDLTAKQDPETKNQWLEVQTGNPGTDWYCKKASGQIQVKVTTPANKATAEKKRRDKEQKKLDLLKRIKEKKEAEERERNEEERRKEAVARAKAEAQRKAEEEAKAAKARLIEEQRRAKEEERKRREEEERRKQVEEKAESEKKMEESWTPEEALKHAYENIEDISRNSFDREVQEATHKPSTVRTGLEATNFLSRQNFAIVEPRQKQSKSLCESCVIL